MRIILSRKGFDSSSGGCPSPILPDGRLLPLPIPDPRSSIRYDAIHWQGHNLGNIVSDLTGGRLGPSDTAHLDPDLNPASLPRGPGWRPLLGQTGAAQGHLRRHAVGRGDIFLFFGLFRQTRWEGGRLRWQTDAPRRHLIWGWLQVDDCVKVDDCAADELPWARYHPHFRIGQDANNTLYLARPELCLPGAAEPEAAGAGLFHSHGPDLALTAPNARLPSDWALPPWFHPGKDRRPLTYHSRPDRWRKAAGSTRLRAVARGQEFILDTDDYPEASGWLKGLLGGPGSR